MSDIRDVASGSELNITETQDSLHADSLHAVSDDSEISSQLSWSAAFQECSDLIHIVAEVKPYTATHGNIIKAWEQVLERLQEHGWYVKT